MLSLYAVLRAEFSIVGEVVAILVDFRERHAKEFVCEPVAFVSTVLSFVISLGMGFAFQRLFQTLRYAAETLFAGKLKNVAYRPRRPQVCQLINVGILLAFFSISFRERSEFSPFGLYAGAASRNVSIFKRWSIVACECASCSRLARNGFSK